MTTLNPAAEPLVRDQPSVDPAESRQRYVRLVHEVAGDGLLRRDYAYYALLIAGIILGLAVTLLQIIRLPASPLLFGWALAFAFFSAQVCGIVHDAGHRAIFASRRWNDVTGEVCCTFLGMGYRAWCKQHNEHHAHPNQEGLDTDLNVPFHAFTSSGYLRQSAWQRHIAKYQAWLFYPMRILVIFSRRGASLQFFWRERIDARLVCEMLLWSVSIACWFIVPVLVFPLGKALLLLATVHIMMGLYLSNVFAPNHKGMPQVAPGARLSFLEQQVITTRNVRPGWFTDFVHMGLNYQIEHHVFPTCPRRNLKRLTPYLVRACADLGLPYTQMSFAESQRRIVSRLAWVAHDASATRPS
jgi:fatty acid desaturase